MKHYHLFRLYFDNACYVAYDGPEFGELICRKNIVPLFGFNHFSFIIKTELQV